MGFIVGAIFVKFVPSMANSIESLFYIIALGTVASLAALWVPFKKIQNAKTDDEFESDMIGGSVIVEDGISPGETIKIRHFGAIWSASLEDGSEAVPAGGKC